MNRLGLVLAAALAGTVFGADLEQARLLYNRTEYKQSLEVLRAIVVKDGDHGSTGRTAAEGELSELGLPELGCPNLAVRSLATRSSATQSISVVRAQHL